MHAGAFVILMYMCATLPIACPLDAEAEGKKRKVRISAQFMVAKDEEGTHRKIFKGDE